jgi:hypothetical protein
VVIIHHYAGTEASILCHQRTVFSDSGHQYIITASVLGSFYDII